MIFMTRNQRTELMKLYNSTVAQCCCCGILLKTQFGDPLGKFFVLSTQGQYLCSGCDCIISEDNIFEPDLYPEDECED